MLLLANVKFSGVVTAEVRFQPEGVWASTALAREMIEKILKDCIWNSISQTLDTKMSRVSRGTRRIYNQELTGAHV